jgi:hypothetical protein
LYLFRYYKLELETTQDPAQRAWLLRRIRESEQEYLTLMQQEHARLERENSNMEEALRRIRAMEPKKK